MGDIIAEATALYMNGLYCSQAVLGSFCEQYGLDKETAFKLSCGLNSGVRSADVCGAVSGAVLVVGLKHGGSKEQCNQETEKFVKIFRNEQGSILCREIMGCDISTPEGAAKARNENLFRTVCVDMVALAARILVDQGY